MEAKFNEWNRRLLAAGGGMLLLSFFLATLEIERFRVVTVEGHVLELMMCAFAAGYCLYAIIALPLVANAMRRLKESAKMGQA